MRRFEFFAVFLLLLSAVGCGGGGSSGGANLINPAENPNQVANLLLIKLGVTNATQRAGDPPQPSTNEAAPLVEVVGESTNVVAVNSRAFVDVSVASESSVISALLLKVVGSSSFFEVIVQPPGSSKQTQTLPVSVDIPGNFDNGEFCLQINAVDANGLVSQAVFQCLQVDRTLSADELFPELVTIPAGNFQMGDLSGLGQPNELPVRTISIDAFAISKTEITFRQWDACVADGGCNGYVPDDLGFGRGDVPVFYVSWDDANNYVAWLSAKIGQPYRLPTEAEWEYAARGGTSTEYFVGNCVTLADANYFDNAELSFNGCPVTGGGGTMPVVVASYSPNDFGVFDMSGNVWEWVQDCANPSYEGAPVDGSASSSGDCGSRMLRGGSWDAPPEQLRSARRIQAPRSERQIRTFGFRVVMAGAPTATPSPTPAVCAFAEQNEISWTASGVNSQQETISYSRSITDTNAPSTGFTYFGLLDENNLTRARIVGAIDQRDEGGIQEYVVVELVPPPTESGQYNLGPNDGFACVAQDDASSGTSVNRLAWTQQTGLVTISEFVDCGNSRAYVEIDFQCEGPDPAGGSGYGQAIGAYRGLYVFQ